MFYEIAQIKRFLAKHHNLPLENPDNDALVRVIGDVPDGDHIIPLGRKNTPTPVRVSDGRITIDPERSVPAKG